MIVTLSCLIEELLPSCLWFHPAQTVPCLQKQIRTQHETRKSTMREEHSVLTGLELALADPGGDRDARHPLSIQFLPFSCNFSAKILPNNFAWGGGESSREHVLTGPYWWPWNVGSEGSDRFPGLREGQEGRVWGRGMGRGRGKEKGVMPPGLMSWGILYHVTYSNMHVIYLPLCGQTDTCENITFPQLHFRTVIIDFFPELRDWRPLVGNSWIRHWLVL